MTGLLTKLARIRPVCYPSHRNFWAWLNIVWNRVDEARIKQVGPDRACAEWLMRNGAFIKWVGDPSYLKDYNALPDTKKPSSEPRFIEEIDATDSSINYMGFPHFVGCKYIKKIRFHRCNHIENKAMKKLSLVKETLEHLQVSSCGNVSDDGVLSLQMLNKLRTLLLFDLPEVTKAQECVQVLKAALPECAVEYREVNTGSKEQDKAKNSVQ